MDKETKSEVLLRYVTTLEGKYGNMTSAEENNDKLFKEMRSFVEQFFGDSSDEQPTLLDVGDCRWTKDEIKEYLKEHYATKDTEDIADVLGLAPDQVRNKACRLGLKKPKNDKAQITAFIIKHYKSMSRRDMAKATGLTYSGIDYYIKNLKAEGKINDSLLQLDSGRKMWTKKEEAYLSEHYPTTDTGVIANTLGRSERSVSVKAHKMGISKQ